MAMKLLSIAARTCLPVVQAELEAMFPKVMFLDPGACCAGPLRSTGEAQHGSLDFIVFGPRISRSLVGRFAGRYVQDNLADKQPVS